MEFLWKSYGVPTEQHADNTGSTGCQAAIHWLEGPGCELLDYEAGRAPSARPTFHRPVLLRGFYPGVIDLRLTLVIRMLVGLQHGFQAVA